jgi:hypothetical protein
MQEISVTAPQPNESIFRWLMCGTVDLAYAEHGMFRQSHTRRSLRGSLFSGTSLGANSNNAGALVDAMRWAHHDESPRRLLLLLLRLLLLLDGRRRRRRRLIGESSLETRLLLLISSKVQPSPTTPLNLRNI